MRMSEDHYYELLDRVAPEGEPELFMGPIATVPDDVPRAWMEILTSPDPRAAAARLWQPVADRVPRIYTALQQRLQGVALLRTEETPVSLVYLFSEGDDWVPYRGLPPSSEDGPMDQRVPADFLEFYGIHDGWTLYYSEDGGPAPRRRWVTLSNVWKDVVWKLPPGDLSEEQTIAVYRDGDELALAFDTSAAPALPLRCHGDGSVDVLIDLWAALDREVGDLLDTLDWTELSDETSPEPVTDRATGRYLQLVSQLTTRHLWAAHLGGGSAHGQAAELLLQCALMEKQGAGRRDQVVDYYRQALEYACASIERSSYVAAEDLLDWFSLAHALEDTTAAHFIATVPTALWADDSAEALQARTLFCLYLGDVEHAAAFVEELAAGTADGDTQSDPDADITLGLLQALTAADTAAYAMHRRRALNQHDAAPTRRRALFPWSLAIRGFDAVGARLGVTPPSSGRE